MNHIIYLINTICQLFAKIDRSLNLSIYSNISLQELIRKTSLRGATLVATKQSRKVIRNGLLRRLTPPSQ
ncbi:hypothetical protein [Candidatus Tisiphia endosymbiont of Hybos culiciformis]|uniref:hypothetical protein n=1 Tax=Candidatus Tisiphia endosymbiont of Hybos culiciformis TaxID=3139331 RepID=UPI003CCB1C4F